MAELDEGIEDETSNYDDETVAKNRFRYANRQQVILFGFISFFNQNYLMTNIKGSIKDQAITSQKIFELDDHF